MSIDLDQLSARAIEAPPAAPRPAGWYRIRADRRRARRRSVAIAGVLAPLVVGAVALIVVRGNDDPAPGVASLPDDPDTASTIPSSSAPPSTQPVTVPLATVPEATAAGALTSTDDPLPVFPHMIVSEPGLATTAVYGMDRCESSVATRVAMLTSEAGIAHAVYGTFCSTVTLAAPVPQSTVSCAAITSGVLYAGCRDAPDAGGGTPGPAGAFHTSTAKNNAATALVDQLPSPTPADAPAVFDGQVTSARAVLSVASVDPTLTAELAAGDDPGSVCFRLQLTGATAEGCVSRQAVASGLAYAAFVRADGIVDVVGIVPDDVAIVEIGGTMFFPTANVWHFVGVPGQSVDFTVRGIDGEASSTLDPVPPPSDGEPLADFVWPIEDDLVVTFDPPENFRLNPFDPQAATEFDGTGGVYVSIILYGAGEPTATTIAVLRNTDGTSQLPAGQSASDTVVRGDLTWELYRADPPGGGSDRPPDSAACQVAGYAIVIHGYEQQMREMIDGFTVSVI